MEKRDFKKRFLKAFLPALGAFLIFGIAKAKAVVPAAIALGVGLGALVTAVFGGLDDIVGHFILALSGFLGFIIDLAGGVFYFLASTVVDFAMGLNSTIASSQVVTQGFETTLLIANIGLVAGIIILAFATMIRADWIVEARSAIPKFIAAALLINFSFFIGMNLLIKPVDQITQQIYKASQYDGESFRGVFQPALDLEPAMRIRLIMAKQEDPDTIEALGKYFEVRDGISGVIAQNLTVADFAIEATGVNVSKTQRQLVTRNISRRIDEWLIDPVDHGFDISWNPIGWARTFADRFILEPAVRTFEGVAGLLTFNKLGDVGAFGDAALLGFDEFFGSIGQLHEKLQDALDEDWLVNSLIGMIQEEFGRNDAPYADNLTDEGRLIAIKIVDESAAVIDQHFACNIYEDNAKDDANCQSLITAANTVDKTELTAWERGITALIEVMFQGLFVFLGSFALLGVGSMYVIRYVALSLLIILFPLVWFGWIFPKIATAGGAKNIWNAWWGQFMRWLLFGPIAMFFFFLAVKGTVAIESLATSKITGEAYFGVGAVTAFGAAAGELFTVLGLLIGGLYVSNKMGIAGSGIFYNSVIKMRNWTGQQFKKLAKLPITNRYTQRGWENIKSASRAKRLDLQTREYRTEKGQKQIKKLLESDKESDRIEGRRRAKKAIQAEDAIRTHAERKFMYRDAKGELQKIPGGYRRSAMLQGLLNSVKNEDGTFKKNISPRAMAEISALTETLHDDGFQWEAPFLEASALMEKQDAYRTYGRQKMENDLIASGLAPAVLEAVHDGKTGDDLVEIMAKEYDKVPDHKLNFDFHLFGDENSPLFGMDKSQYDEHQKAVVQYMAQRKPGVLQKHLNRANYKGRAKFDHGIEEYLDHFHEVVFQDYKTGNKRINRARSGGTIEFDQANTADRMRWIQENQPLALSRLQAAGIISDASELPLAMDKMKQLESAARGGIAGFFFFDGS